jgi:exportin-T
MASSPQHVRVLFAKFSSVLTNFVGNQPQLEALLGTMQRLAEDVSDPSSQRAAFQFLGRCVTVWVQPIDQDAMNGNQNSGIPGFETFVYERLIPAAFSVLASPQFNIKDGQMLVVSQCFCGVFTES